MAIDERNIVVGGLYKTHTNQERVVLEIKDDEVKYASRGGNVENKFDHMQKAKLITFAGACSEKIKDLPSDEFNKIRQLFVDRKLI
ncbi:TPA: hypothetical protein JLE42_002821 [Escherichia coli]|nr:hypothetical protein [Escherichia coli]